MKYDDLIKHFGTQDKTAKALHCTRQAVSIWAVSGEIPLLRQYQIEVETGGALKADRADNNAAA